jgi:bud emergence protein 1
LRKSLREKTKSSSISSPISEKITSISSINDLNITNNNLLQSPKKVIKALYDYKPQGPGELEFKKGDFFHVIGNEDDPEWYEACNPSTNVRGMVPVPYFEVFGKTRPINSTSQQSVSETLPHDKKLSMDSHNSTKSTGSSTLYAIVLYDFKAERPDELDVHAGENIILCAHHSYEWFIAKPIDRLGGPGLVPVSYVGVIDITTGNSSQNDVADDINGAGLPTVDEWKNKNAKYKASSIPLGDVSTPVQSSNHAEKFSDDTQVDENLPYIVESSVDSFHVDQGRYWFHMSTYMSNGEQRSLCRYYEDFYDFQIKLLELFPDEAGRGSQKRILPFIPGPLTYVTDKITQKRTVDLNEYVKELISLPVYISHCQFVKSLFDVKHELDHLIDSEEQERTIVKEESVKTLNASEPKSVKLKFFYRDDIFALLLTSTTTFPQLREKIITRIYDDEVKPFQVFIRQGDEPGEEVVNDDDVQYVLENKLKMIIKD